MYFICSRHLKKLIQQEHSRERKRCKAWECGTVVSYTSLGCEFRSDRACDFFFYCGISGQQRQFIFPEYTTVSSTETLFVITLMAIMVIKFGGKCRGTRDKQEE